MIQPALETTGLCRSFGSLVVAGDINFALRPGARHALIGPNGAGKTTFINLLTGQLAPSAGTVRLAGEDVTALKVHQRVRRGLARTFQINTLLREMTVLEGVQLAVLEHWSAGTKIFRGRATQRRAADYAYDLLARLRMDAHANDRVGALAYGRQRLVEIATALALEPTVLLLDEPAAGVPPADSHLVLDLIAALPASISVLIIEHDMKLVFRFAEKISVLVAGRLLIEGTPAEIADNPLVREVYLGTGHHG
jgi:branched-chain amino acid transport system ATP-binding protein